MKTHFALFLEGPLEPSIVFSEPLVELVPFGLGSLLLIDDVVLDQVRARRGVRPSIPNPVVSRVVVILQQFEVPDARLPC
jgi:hypothetical protein